MGWKGAVRSVSASMRRAERESQRRYKLLQKENEKADSAAAVQEWHQFIREVTSLHSNHAESVDWEEIVHRPKPVGNAPTHRRALVAQEELDNFKPRKLDFLRGGSEKQRSKLLALLEHAKQKDEAENIAQEKADAAAEAEWAADVALARLVLRKEPTAIRDVISEYQTLSDDDLIGSSLSFTMNDEFVHCVANVHDDSLIPNVRRKQLASGRLSESKMPQGEFNELYQDYVASVAIRIAADLFAILPITECYVTCQASMLNSGTGHLEATPILSVFFIKATVAKLRLESIDPSDALVNFVHHMKFKRTSGFERIEALKN